MKERFLELIKSRRIWVLLVSLAVLLVQVWVPSFKLNEGGFVNMALVVVPMMVGLAVDPGSPVDKWKLFLTKSRKFGTAFIGMVVLVLHGFGLVVPLGVTPEVLTMFFVVIAGLISSFALEKKPVLRLVP